MVYEGYMVRYIVGFCVSNNHLCWGHEVGVPRFMKSIWYGTLLVSE